MLSWRHIEIERWTCETDKVMGILFQHESSGGLEYDTTGKGWITLLPPIQLARAVTYHMHHSLQEKWEGVPGCPKSPDESWYGVSSSPTPDFSVLWQWQVFDIKFQVSVVLPFWLLLSYQNKSGHTTSNAVLSPSFYVINHSMLLALNRSAGGWHLTVMYALVIRTWIIRMFGESTNIYLDSNTK